MYSLWQPVGPETETFFFAYLCTLDNQDGLLFLNTLRQGPFWPR